MITPEKRGDTGGKTNVEVKVNNLVDRTVFYWNKAKFQNRRDLILNMYNDFKMKDPNWDLPQQDDPFYENPETTQTIIGVTSFYCENILNKIDMENEGYFITDLKGQNVTEMFVGSYPIDNKGNIDRMALVEEPEELIGQKLAFVINIQSIGGLSSRFKNVWIEYKFDGECYTSPKTQGKRDFEINFKNKIVWPRVTEDHLKQLEKGLFTTIYANQIPRQEGIEQRRRMTTRKLRQEFIEQSCLDKMTSAVNVTQQPAAGPKEIIKEVEVIKYVDRPVEVVKENEVIKYVDRPVEVIKENEVIKYVDRPVEVVKENEVIKYVKQGKKVVPMFLSKNEKQTVDGRIELIEVLVKKAKGQSKKTIPIKDIDEILNGQIAELSQLPERLKSDLKISEEARTEVQVASKPGANVKSANCTIM